MEAIELAIIENMQRVDLNCIEEAEGYRDLIELAGMTQVRVAAAVNRSQGWVSTILRLLTLPDGFRSISERADFLWVTVSRF